MKSFFVLVGLLLFAVPIYIRLLYHVPYIIAGSLLPVLVIFVAGTQISLQGFNKLNYSKSRIGKFAFHKSSNWVSNISILKNDLNSDIDKQIYPENFIINDTLNNIVSLILRDFVESWFVKISSDRTFTVSLRHEFTYIIKILYSRLAEVDFSDLVVHNLTPILADHVDKFSNAQEITKNKKVTKTADKPIDANDDSALASNYNRGLLHAGVRLNSETPEADLNDYLSTLIDRILPCLLEENELDSAPVRILIRELVTSCVLNPVSSMLSDPDFYNQIIVSNLSKQMKDRNNVRKFRNVLRRHSMSFNNLTMPTPGGSDILQYKVSIDTPKQDFEKILQMVEQSIDPQALLKYKYYMLLRNEKLMKLNPNIQIEESKTLQKYAKRCNTLLNAINSKLKELTEGEESSKPELEDKNKSTTEQLETLPQTSISKHFSLHEVLSSPTRLKYFTSYMQLRGDRHALLDFWLSAESLRNPLEYNNVQSKPTLTNMNTSEDDEESSDEETTMFVDNELTQADDIKNIFNKYFNLPVMKVPPKIFYKVSEFIEGNCTSTLAYYRARKSILKLQDFEYIRMKKSDFVAFKASDVWLKLLVEEAVNSDQKSMKEGASADVQLDSETTDQGKGNKQSGSNTASKETDKIYGDPLARYSEKENDGNYVDVNMTGKVSDKVVRAVEDALNEIMKDSNKSDVDLGVNNDKRNSRLVSDDVARDLFGSGEKSLFGDEEAEEETEKELKVQDNSDITGSHHSTDLDGETAVSSSHDSVSVASNSSEVEDPMEKSDLKVVAPSVLNLYNEIERLDVEIDRLQKQRLILKALLQKAEVVNNVPELRILKKSLISLEKELKFKSMQKEQYIVQEGENSLYERSKVTIPSYITAKDKNGKSFIMYVIKVTTLSRTDPNQITANWMVTRRFSQFFELHNYLKSKYPLVSNMDFPKKKMMVKFIQGSLVEERQKKLKVYLQELVKNKDVCSDKIFRDFLSSETFDATLDDTLQHVNEKIKKSTDGSGTKLYNIISSQALYPLLSLTNYKGINDQLDEKKASEKSTELLPISTENEIENEEDLSLDEDNITTPESRAKDISFMKPICDLIVSVFQLNNSTSWFRGRALILLFQQLFGSTVEKVLRANIDGKIKQEETISKILTGLQYTLWPDGEFKKKRTPRTIVEKERTKQQTRMLLSAFLTDTSSKIFGQTAANRASDTLYFVFQNEILNRHLLLSILDECLSAIFPEIGK